MEAIKKMQDNITFIRLINDYKITIPVIQRDYAQGRSTPKETEIRDGFLSAIIDVLQSSEAKPLILDFIYGATNSDNVFTPLDGQQRLTTLFLLHWYLSEGSDLHKLTTNEGNSTFSKFSYETRISSKNFCDKLVQQEYSIIKQTFVNLSQEIEELIILANTKGDESDKKEICEKLNKLESQKENWKLSNTIKDQAWFLWAWQKDPTVFSMLVMLDDIESRLSSLTTEQRKYYLDRLEYIVFHLLPLEKFNLSDELYVKMNARGKELSEFDILKSTLEEQMRLNNVEETLQQTWQTNFDSSWLDIFWNKIAKPTLTNSNEVNSQEEAVDNVELAYLRFIKRMITYHLFIEDECLNCDFGNETIKRYIPFEYTTDDNLINKLRDYAVRNDVSKLIPLFCKSNFFDASFFNFIVSTFKSLVFREGEILKDGTDLITNISFEHIHKSIFEEFIAEKINYDTPVQFFAILKFFEFNPASDIAQNQQLINELNSWMRVIRNLSTNTNTYYYNTYEDFLKSINEVQKWSKIVYDKNSSTILSFLSDDNNKLSGFDNGQLKEEQIKAQLLQNSNGHDWQSEIFKIEEHKYFLGQIRFLLNWSKDENDNYQFNDFKNYVEKINKIFDNGGLVSQLKENHVFKNALICTDSWYLLNNCFIKFDNNKDRDWSWKRYLRNDNKSLIIKNLLKEWDIQENQEVELFLKDYIVQNKPSNWRKYFIEFPEIYDSLFDKKISWWYSQNGKKEMCLLSKTRWSSRHKELTSYYWFLKYKDSDNDKYLDSTEETHPFSAIFKRSDNKEFSIKYIPKWEDGWQQGQYVISTNFDSTSLDFQQNHINGRWERFFMSDAKDDIETLLQNLNN